MIVPPTVQIEAPPALGSAYQRAKTVALLQATSHMLRIKVVDRGQGYTSLPDVFVFSYGVSRQCAACAVIDRDLGYGHER
jgi:hypothetical protein